jgi:hypothetical protein
LWESLQSTVAEAMTADSFLALLLAREWDYRSDAAIERLIRGAGLSYLNELIITVFNALSVDLYTKLYNPSNRDMHSNSSCLIRITVVRCCKCKQIL